MDQLLISVLVVLSISFTSSIIVVLFLTYNYHSLVFRAVRIRERPADVPGPVKTPGDFLLGSLSSAGAITLLLATFRQELFTLEAPAHWSLYIIQPLMILLVYDMLYYFVHRFVFHNPKLKKCFHAHAKHHRVRHPVPIDAIFVHPLENVIVMLLVFVSIGVFAPVNVVVFGIAFFAYVNINLLLHSGIAYPRPFSFLSYLTVLHDRHHMGMDSKNYSSITVLPDLLFGTQEK